jgi:hypothetical protein
MNQYDEINKARAAMDGGTLEPKRLTILERLYSRRAELQNQLRRVENTINALRGNEAIVEVVEAVLAAQDKVDPYPAGQGLL